MEEGAVVVQDNDDETGEEGVSNGTAVFVVEARREGEEEEKEEEAEEAEAECRIGAALLSEGREGETVAANKVEEKGEAEA